MVRFLFSPPPLTLPVVVPPVPLSGFAERLARHPIDLVTHLGMERANAYFAAGCPLELCDHAAARDLWAVVHHETLCSEPPSTKELYA